MHEPLDQSAGHTTGEKTPEHPPKGGCPNHQYTVAEEKTPEHPPKGGCPNHQHTADEVVLGFDYGSRRLGVAVGQTISRTASPLTTLAVRDRGPDWQGIGALIEEWRPQRLIVGLPLNMRLEEQPMTRAARRFSRQLAGRYHLPVTIIDECLSSHAAKARAPKARTVDAWAAALIIETWLATLPPAQPTDEQTRP